MNITLYLDVIVLKFFLLEIMFLYGGGFWFGSKKWKDKGFNLRILITALIQSFLFVGLYIWLLNCSQVILVICEVFCIALGFWFCYGLRGFDSFFAMLLALTQTMICLGKPFVKLPGIVLAAILLFGFHKKDKQEILYDTQFLLEGKVVTCKAIIDTGNSLREPYKNRAVCVIEKAVLEELLDGRYDMENMFYVPFHSVGQNKGLMKAFVTHNVIISSKQNRIVLPEMVVGIMEEQMDIGNKYQMLLHKEYVKYF